MVQQPKKGNQLIVKLLPIKRYLFVVVLLVLLGLLLLISPPEPLKRVFSPSNTVKTKALPFPLFYMRDMKTVQYAVNGRPLYQLETVKFDYYEGPGETAEDRQANAYATLERPLLTFYGEEPSAHDKESSTPDKATSASDDKAPSTWRLSAANGESRDNGELVILTGDVRLWQMRDGMVTTELTTQSMTVNPVQAFAQTDQQVVASNVTSTIEATGVKFYIDSNEIEFLSAVKGVYDEF